MTHALSVSSPSDLFMSKKDLIAYLLSFLIFHVKSLFSCIFFRKNKNKPYIVQLYIKR